ncbi:MAG: 4Fe-4S dicluster domain-containing protein [Bacteroidales bacterium]|nr:4Fe-4S dicluster domain-containing protein [Bacteroidales bacterium]
MKKYRKDILSEQVRPKDDLSPEPAYEFDPLPELIKDSATGLHSSRRDFLKLCGYSFALAALSSCRSKISKAIPYVIAPNEITPGDALYYSSSYVNGSDYCSIIVKTRDGRPIKIEGNPRSSMTRGGTNARVQASVLDLYDMERFKEPISNGVPVSWDEADGEITARLKKISYDHGSIVLLTPTVYSPSTEAVITDFIEKFPGTAWVRYDAVSYSAMLEANLISFGRQVIPRFHFDKADVIVSSGADFLGTWLSPVEFTKQFSSRRDPEGSMNYLIQYEAGLSVTGCTADKRIQIRPSQEYALLLNIYREVVKLTEGRESNAPSSPADVRDIAVKLTSSPGRSLVISGSNVKDIQLLVNEINRYLGNIGTTIDFSRYMRTHEAIDSGMADLVSRMNAGDVDALIFWNVNPAYTWYDRDAFTKGLKKVGIAISLSGSPDETSSLVQYICPDNHYLESWNDAEPEKDLFSLMQPVISPLFNTRQMADTLLKWSGSAISYYDFIRSYWAVNMLPRQKEYSDPVAFFDHSLQEGVFETVDKNVRPAALLTRPVSHVFDPSLLKTGDDREALFEVVLYEPVAIGEGRQANNPWLHELPDPVTRICWDNYASISGLQAKENSLTEGDLIDIGGLTFPVHIQPGQAYGTLSIALGYGRKVCGMAGNGVGSDAWPFLTMDNGNVSYTRTLGRIGKTGSGYLFAQTQGHHSMEGRALIRETGLNEFKVNPSAGNELHEHYTRHAKSLYKEREYPHHHWGMVIDLSKCTGCGACVIACQAENNVPVVGKEEVQRVHEMHWIRIDRYYSGDDMDPEVGFQPVLCQHCENAPCENVCPVGATNHSGEGLNQMIYNRCFGTRYCNNNCPYKVRRFNWFNYTGAGTLRGNLRDKAGMTGDLRRMVLNPDVTVRSQGVIEKCSFCIQRIQAAKLKAKTEKRALYPGEIRTACSQSCPANAIIFGDLNDKESEMNRLIRSGRNYNLLEELFTKPSVNYLTRIRNRT